MQIALILLKMMQFTPPQQHEGEGKQNGNVAYCSHQTNKAVTFMIFFQLLLKKSENEELLFSFNPRRAW